jgi:hypothetical protein
MYPTARRVARSSSQDPDPCVAVQSRFRCHGSARETAHDLRGAVADYISCRDTVRIAQPDWGPRTHPRHHHPVRRCQGAVRGRHTRRRASRGASWDAGRCAAGWRHHGRFTDDRAADPARIAAH